MAVSRRDTDGVRVRGLFTIPATELQWTFSRSSGPGGQGVNTTDSRVQLRWDLEQSASIPEALRARARTRLGSRLVDGCVVVTASEQRSQWQNRRAAQQRLATLLAAAVAAPPRPRRATQPSRSAQQRRLEAKKQRGRTKRLRQAPRDEFG